MTAQKQTSHTDEVYSKIESVSSLLSSMYDLDSQRVDEITMILHEAKSELDLAEQQIRELQTQVLLYQRLTKEQEQIIENAKMCFRALQRHGPTPHIIRGFMMALKIGETA